MPTSPTPERVRLTITVTAEVHEVFSRIAAVGGMSLGRAMGDWLEDTLDVATYTATKMEEAKSAPRKVVRELHAYAQGMADETGQLMETIREKAAAQRASAAPPPPSPRSVIRGVKSPEQGRPSPKHYSALDHQGNRHWLLEGQYFDKAGVIRTRAPKS